MLTHVFPRRKDVDIYAIDSCQGGGWRVYGDGGQVPIGLWPELDYEGEAISDMHGKTLFVYTDGINEAENIHKEQFGDERLRALLKQDLGDARQTSETIHKAVEDFVGDAERSDDLTKMCIKMQSA